MNDHASLAEIIDRLAILQRGRDEWAKTYYNTLCEIGGMMRSNRLLAGVSLRELARRMGVSAPFLSDMERGSRAYTIEHVRKAFAELGKEGR